MKFPRRGFLSLAAAAAAVPIASRIAFTQGYPTRPVRLIVPFGAGGAPDILARLAGQWLSERLGQPFIVENRPGANGNLGTQGVIETAADGNTLLLASFANVVNASLYQNLSFDFIRDTVPVGSISRDPDVMVVTPSFPAKSVPEFIAYAKANPGKINMGSPGVGTSPHMAGELFKFLAKVDLTHVAYRASPPVITDLLGGQVQVYFMPISAGIEYVKAGKLRALGVTTATRSEALPDIPVIGDFVPGYEVSAWYGIVAPKNTPAAIIETLNKEINAGLANPKLKVHLADLGSSPFVGSPVAFGKFLNDETDKWAKVVKSAGIKPD
jgi:tripartite-type tricarboxylate transporter receptor subunit TctC